MYEGNVIMKRETRHETINTLEQRPSEAEIRSVGNPQTFVGLKGFISPLK
jgi:hypothetical protein